MRTDELLVLLILAVLLVLMERWLVKWGRETVEKQYRADDGAGRSHLPETALMPLDDTPDGPVSFGYKTAWLAVRCREPRQMAEMLNCRYVESANWTTGLSRSMETGGQLFLSPVLDGFALMTGQDLFALTERRDELEMLAEQFPEVQYFASYRVSSAYWWARYVDGACVRAYRMEDDEVLWDEGDLTPEERALGFERFPRAGQEDGGQFPDEEDVLDIAAAWGMDPRFQKKTYPPSVGWVCD